MYGVFAELRIPVTISSGQEGLEGAIMSITVEAVYENGVLKPSRLLPLKEHEKVRITIANRPSVAEQTYGMMGWTGDAETLDRLLEEAEFGDEEAP
jgi:predicted DNA-binding antitoxin AbrB/MazE fold protein